MEPMKAVSVTFCRDRSPQSKVAPREPLPPELWEQLRAGVAELATMGDQAAMVLHVEKRHLVPAAG